MHNDASTADGLLRAIVIDHMLAVRVFSPDLDAEGVGRAVHGGNLELVTALAVDRAGAL